MSADEHEAINKIFELLHEQSAILTNVQVSIAKLEQAPRIPDPLACARHSARMDVIEDRITKLNLWQSGVIGATGVLYTVCYFAWDYIKLHIKP